MTCRGRPDRVLSGTGMIEVLIRPRLPELRYLLRDGGRLVQSRRFDCLARGVPLTEHDGVSGRGSTCEPRTAVAASFSLNRPDCVLAGERRERRCCRSTATTGSPTPNRKHRRRLHTHRRRTMSLVLKIAGRGHSRASARHRGRAALEASRPTTSRRRWPSFAVVDRKPDGRGRGLGVPGRRSSGERPEVRRELPRHQRVLRTGLIRAVGVRGLLHRRRDLRRGHGQPRLERAGRQVRDGYLDASTLALGPDAASLQLRAHADGSVRRGQTGL